MEFSCKRLQGLVERLNKDKKICTFYKKSGHTPSALIFVELSLGFWPSEVEPRLSEEEVN